MSTELASIARPYAQAIFELAKDQQAFDTWSTSLALATRISEDASLQAFIENPLVDMQQVADAIITIAGDGFGAQQQHLIKLLAQNKRLMLIPVIEQRFATLRAEHDNTMQVDVLVAKPLSDQQQQTLTQSLTKRFQRDITLNVMLDETILGGAVIRAGDDVIDGSVRDKLDQLKQQLAA